MNHLCMPETTFQLNIRVNPVNLFLKSKSVHALGGGLPWKRG